MSCVDWMRHENMLEVLPRLKTLVNLMYNFQGIVKHDRYLGQVLCRHIFNNNMLYIFLESQEFS